MTINTTNDASGPYVANGVTTAFPFTFDVSAPGDVSVVTVDAAGLITEISSALYTVALAAGDDPGGTVNFTSAPEFSDPLWVTLDPSFLQQIGFEDEGAFNQSILNPALDQAAMRALWLRGRVERAIKVPFGETAPEMAPIAGQDGKVIGIVNGRLVPVANTASGLEQTAADLAQAVEDFGVIIGAEQYRVSIARATWAELNAIVGSANQTAMVLGSDTGTHTDNVTAGHPTVPNSGVYRYSTSPVGWQWLAPAETAASALTATSKSNVTIGTGNKNFQLEEAGKAFVQGMNVVAYNDATHQMAGTVQSFNANSGLLVISVTSTVGTLSKANWNIFLSGPSGINGANGSDGASAYEIAVAHGYVGTEAQWLASLQAQSTTDAQTAALAAQTAQGLTETAAAAALGAWDSFDDRYLGSYAADPGVDNDGNALQVGARYWNSPSNVMKTWSGSGWIADIGVTIDTDGALAANSDALVPSQKAVKSYVDNKVAGLSWKQAVRAATVAAGTLATSFANGQAIDGVTLATGDRILVKNQATASENGIYTVNASGAPTRASDADSGAELVNASVYVSEGTTLADTQWTCSTNAPITVGTTGLAFAQFAVSGALVDVKATADQTTTSASLVDVTNLAFAPAANTEYEVEAFVPCTLSVGSNNFHIGVAWPTGLTYGYAEITYAGADGTNQFAVFHGTSAAAFETGGVQGGNGAIRIAKIRARIKAGASPSGSFKVQFGANGSLTATIKAGAYLRYRAM